MDATSKKVSLFRACLLALFGALLLFLAFAFWDMRRPLLVWSVVFLAVANDTNVAEKDRREERPDDAEREAAPHRRFICIQLGGSRCVGARLVDRDTESFGFVRQHRVVDDRRDGEAERASELNCALAWNHHRVAVGVSHLRHGLE